MSEIKEKSALRAATPRAENKRFMKNSISILEQAEKKIKSFEAKKLGQKAKVIAEPTANGVAIRSARPHVHREPTIKINAPTVPPPCALSSGFQSVDPKNSNME